MLTRENRVLTTGLALGLACSLGVCLAIGMQSLVVGSNEGSWVSAAAIVVLGRQVERRERLMLATWVALAVALQGALRSLTPYSFARIFASNSANSFYDVTQHYHASSVMSHFLQLRTVWPLHAQSNMPGKLMLLYAMELVSNRPAVLAWFALVLYTFVPGRIWFLPLFNTVTPTLVLASAWFCVRWSPGSCSWRSWRWRSLAASVWRKHSSGR